MAKRNKKDLKRSQWEQENKTIREFHRKAPAMKLQLRAAGCNLAYYEYLDSSRCEFNSIVSNAITKNSTLLGIFEVEPKDLETGNWEKYGVPDDWELIVFNKIDEPLIETYGQDNGASLRGGTVCFTDSNGHTHTLIRTSQVKSTIRHSEFNYMVKIPALLHEIGHVEDIEKQINFNIEARTWAVLDSEAFANIYAFEECVKHNYFRSYNVFLESLKQYQEDDDFRGRVVRRTLQNLPPQEPINWQDYGKT